MNIKPYLLKVNLSTVIILTSILAISVYIAYHAGVSHGKIEVEKNCLTRANELCEARKSEFKLNFCEMPPPVITIKECNTSEDN